MDNGQFQIPLHEQAADPQMIQEIESSFDVADVQEMNEQLSPYEVSKNNEREIESYRANATEETLPKPSTVDRARVVVTGILERL